MTLAKNVGEPKLNDLQGISNYTFAKTGEKVEKTSEVEIEIQYILRENKRLLTAGKIAKVFRWESKSVGRNDLDYPKLSEDSRTGNKR